MAETLIDLNLPRVPAGVVRANPLMGGYDAKNQVWWELLKAYILAIEAGGQADFTAIFAQLASLQSQINAGLQRDKDETITGTWTFNPLGISNPPFLVGNTGVITNLNADLLDGYDSSKSAIVDSVAVRYTDGRLVVGEPVAGSDAVTLTYYNANLPTPYTLSIGNNILSSTPTSILFVGASNDFQQDAGNFSWDSSTKTLYLKNPSGGTNEKLWGISISATGVFSIDTYTDAGAFGSNLFSAPRSGVVPANVTLSLLNVTGLLSAGDVESGGIFRFLTGGQTISHGIGSPETVVTAPPGSLYTNRSGGAGTTLYVKESGSGNTGWVAK